MAILTEFLTSIANAIRSKKGTTDPIPASDFSTEINSIEDRLVDFLGNKLTSLTIPAEVGTIGKYAFYNNNNLQYIDISEGITEIGEYAFYNLRDSNNNIELKIFVPESVSVINNNALSINSTSYYGDIYFKYTLNEYFTKQFKTYFLNCDKVYFLNENEEFELLENLIIPNNVELTKACFKGINSLKSVIIEEGQELIAEYSFSNCQSLEKVILPSTITRIENYAFEECYNLSEITIPSSVTYMGSSSLKCGLYSNKLTVIMEGTTPPTINSYTFAKSYLNKIFVPTGSKDTYIAATNWSSFADYIFEPNESVTLNVDSTLLNNENYLYSTDQGSTWNQFTSETISLEYISTIWFKNLVSDVVITVGTTSGGSEIGTIANAELQYTTSASEVIYLGVQ